MKQLQKMSGVSWMTYWGSMYLFDLITYLIMVVILLFTAVSLDTIMDLKMFYRTEICNIELY